MLEDIRVFHIADFKECQDPVRTEEFIFNQITSRTILTEYVYAAFPIAHTINSKGIQVAQSAIDQTCSQLDGNKAFFVCQHIRVSDLNFHGHLVFTPHATTMDGYKAIPHYAPNYVDKNNLKPFDRRNNLMSFQGAFWTHQSRRDLKHYFDKDYIILDSGKWNFEKKEEERKKFEEKYLTLLNDTKVSLCPRGTGPSTIRLWESMASGCVPLIISDHLKMPMEDIMEWEDMIITVPQNDVKNLLDYIPEDATLEHMSKDCVKTYYNLFDNDSLYKSIVTEI